MGTSKTDRLLQELGGEIEESLGVRKRPKPKLVAAKPAKQADSKEAPDYTSVPIVQIKTEKQHRVSFDADELAKLATTIEAHGVIQPIVVRWDEPRGCFVVVAGERRFRAAKLAKLTEVPCRVMRLGDGEIAEIQLIENLNREDLNAIELAKAFQNVMNRTSRTAKEMARRLGIDATTVTRTLRLLRLPNDVQQLVIDGKLSSRQAREIARVGDETSQRAFVRRTIDEGLNGSEVEEMVKGYLGEKRRNHSRSKIGAKHKAVGSKLTFPTEHGTVRFFDLQKATNHHVAAALKQALEEVELRIRNRVTE